MPSFPSSLPRICIALGLDSPAELAQAAEREYRDGGNFLEFRLDYLADPAAGIAVLRNFIDSHPDAYVLATCRHKHNQGRFVGTLDQQIEILTSAAAVGAVAVDLEIESAEQTEAQLGRLRKLAPLVVSYHNFETTPALNAVLRRLQHIPADAYKVATTALKPSHNLRLIQLTRQRHGVPLIALAMSECGAATRLLGPLSGSLFTYAAPSKNQGTAPGQISAKLMRTLYRCEKLSKQSRIYGVIADPVAHSKSPLIHNRAFQARRLDAVYLPFRVGSSQLREWMALASFLPVAGFSVTIPHKQRILRHLDIVEPLAKRIGAVNTVWRKAGKWRGTNTDAAGVVKPLSRHIRLAHASILIAGYGGAARAAALALSDAGGNIIITGRNLESAETLARAVKAEVVSLEEATKRRFDALVHATPVGMFPNTEECLFRDAIPAATVFDMVYNPHETLLLKRAKEQGCTVIYGSEMFLEQAASQFEIWTGESAPRAVMRNTLEQQSP